MPYIGQRPSKGDENNFKILDNISSYTLTFDGSDSSIVSAANDTITSLTHRFVQGQRVTYNKGSGGTVIAGLSDGVYFIIKEDHNTIKLATSASNATNGIAVNLTGVGGGSSHTLNVAFDGVNTKFKATHTNGQKTRITRSAQLVISINGVIQQPHDTATPSTGFGFDLDGTIVFSQAPVSTDEYWAHVLTNNNVTFDISDNDIDNFTGDGNKVSFNLSKTPPDNRNVLVTIDGVIQYPNDPDGTVRSYTVVENVLTFITAPANGVEIQVRHIGFAGSSSGSGSGGVTSFYGRTGAVVLKNTDNIVANNAEFAGNLTVQGTMTTLDTKVTEVDQLEVAANNTTVGVAITQSGTGDILNLYDGSTEVVSFNQHGNLTITNENPIINFIDSNNDSDYRIQVEAGSFLIEDLTNNHHDSFVIKNTKIGINDNNPERTLDVVGDNAMIQIEGSGGNGRQYSLCSTDDTTGAAVGSAGQFVIYDDTSGSNRFNITGVGSVGINEDDPKALLHVAYDNGQTLPTISTSFPLIVTKNSNSGIAIIAKNDAKSILAFGDTDDADRGKIQYVHTSGSDADSMQFLTAGDERLRISSGGNVSLGTQVSNERVNIHTASSLKAQVQFTNNTTGTGGGDGLVFGITGGEEAIIWNQENTDMAFATNNTERLRIDNNGRLIAGGASAGTYHGDGDNLNLYSGGNTGLTVFSGTSSLGSLFFADGNNNVDEQRRGAIQYNHDDDSLAFWTNAVEKVRINSDGNVGIGTDTLDSSANLSITDTGSARIYLKSGNTSDTSIYFGRLNDSATAAIRYEHSTNAFDFYGYNNSKRMTIASNGDVKVISRGSNESGAPFYVAVTGKSTVDYGGGSDDTACLRIEDNGTNDNYYHGIELRAKRSGDARIYVQDKGSDQVDLVFATDNSGLAERLRITSAGQVQINRDGGSAALTLGASQDFRLYHDANGPTIFSDNNNQGLKLQIKELNLTEYTGATTKLKIDSSYRILKGLTTARGNFANNTSGVEFGFQIEATSGTDSTLSIIRSSNDANDGGIFIGKTRSTSVGGNTVVQAGDDLGTITFGGADGTSLQFGAQIIAEVQSGVGNDDMPTDLIFKTNGGSTSTVERLRIKSGGTIAIPGQGSSNANPRLLIEDGTGGSNDFSISQYEDGNGTYTLIGQNVQLLGNGNETILDSNHKTASIYLDARNNGGIFFSTGGTNEHTEKLRITSGGQLLHTANKNSGYTARFVQSHADNPAVIEIDSPSNNHLRPSSIKFMAGGTDKWGIGEVYNPVSQNSFHICTGSASQSTSKVMITSAGRVGVGTYAPQAKVDVVSFDTLGSVFRRNFNGSIDDATSKLALTIWGQDHDDLDHTTQDAYGPMIGFGARNDDSAPNVGDIRAGISYLYNGDLTFHAKAGSNSGKGITDGSHQRMSIDGGTGHITVGTNGSQGCLQTTGIGAIRDYYDMRNINLDANGFDAIGNDSDGGNTFWEIKGGSIIRLYSTSGGHGGTWGKPVYIREAGYYYWRCNFRVTTTCGAIHNNTSTNNYQYPIMFRFNMGSSGTTGYNCFVEHDRQYATTGSCNGSQTGTGTLADGTRVTRTGNAYYLPVGSYQPVYFTNGYLGVRELHIYELALIQAGSTTTGA